LITGFRSQKALAILTYLVSEGRPITREYLAGLAWPEVEQSRALGLLRRSLHNLSSQLPACLEINRRTVFFKPDAPANIDIYRETQTLYDQIKQAAPCPPHNLPPQITPFLGRETELAELTRLLAKPQHRLITLAGPGSMGKTGLAMAMAERQLGRPTEQPDRNAPSYTYFTRHLSGLADDGRNCPRSGSQNR
jgi:hypothetical protein